ncbi:hypothetical protein GLP24_15625 [Photobacterium carnosum]|uniref:hypothetical protein n=1 Tax=Photobacterium carnosum TaxID=2023717 RepID=UPI001E3C056B|nr:hypothetical protein [Photobacterium carnosum]MCD9546272.1 hypothetical protein [Photobacterium carnosum]
MKKLMISAFLLLSSMTLIGFNGESSASEYFGGNIYGDWKLKNIDGKAVSDPNATGDHREAYFVKLESLEGEKLLSLKCQTLSTTRSDWYKAPSVRVAINFSDYNKHTGKMWNNKQILSHTAESKALWRYLENEDVFTYTKRHTFDTKGFKNTWNKAMGHCLSAYNIYIKEWNEKKGTDSRTVDPKLY